MVAVLCQLACGAAVCGEERDRRETERGQPFRIAVSDGKGGSPYRTLVAQNMGEEAALKRLCGTGLRCRGRLWSGERAPGRALRASMRRSEEN